MQRSVLGLGVVVVVLALGGTAVAAWLVMSLGEIDRYEDLSTDAAPAGEPRNYLVVGSDSRAESTDGSAGSVRGQRSDTIMVVRLDPATNHADMLSIPRDLVVPIAGTGDEARINSAYSQGRQVLIDTLRDNFGIEVNHYVEIDFRGFQELVQAIGGVSLWLEDAVKDRASGLYVTDRGCVTLDGEQALAFARSRQMQYMTPDGWSRPDPFADLGRIQRQQVFIRRALTRALHEARSNPLTFRDLVSIGVSSVGIDGGTDPLELARQFKDFDTDDLTTYSVPVVESGDGATVLLDDEAAEPVFAVFRGDDPDDAASGAGVPPSAITVLPFNGTPVAGRAAELAAGLEEIGFGVGTPDNIGAHERTTVYHRPGDAATARQVAAYVDGGAELVEADGDLGLDLDAGEVALVVGADHRGLLDEPTAPVTVTTTAAPAAGPGGQDGGGPATTVPGGPEQDDTPGYAEFTVGDPPPGVDCD
jgi:LCP family protein required for cell wall assembly